MRSLRAWLLSAGVLASACCGATLVFAQEEASPEALSAAKELASLMSASTIAQLVADISDQIWPNVETALRINNPKLDSATLAELRKEYERLQVDALFEATNDAAPIYARHFTAQELHELVAFYHTTTGAKALRVMPRANLELLDGVSPRLRRLSETVRERFAAILRQRGFVP